MNFKHKVTDQHSLFVSAAAWDASLRLDPATHPIAAVQTLREEMRRWHEVEVTVAVPAHSGWGQWVAGWIFEPVHESKADVGPWSKVAEAAQLEVRGTRLDCPLERRARSVFLAGIRRGREPKEFSREIWVHLLKYAGAAFSPAVDPFPPSHHFQRELDLLDRDEGAYARDFARAIRFCAFLHTGPDGKRKVHEGIWIEDPESLLFADWAWRDSKNSTEHKGFALVVVREGGRWRIAADPTKELSLDGLLDALKEKTGKPWLQAPEITVLGYKISVEDSDVGWRSLWCDAGDVDGTKIEKAIREYCEGGLFANGAEWVHTGQADESELRPHADNSRPGCRPRIEFIRCQLSSDVGYKIPMPAAQVIYRGLWTLVRPEEDQRPGTPGNFDDHCQGDSGLLTVWSRTALAAGWADASAKCLMNDLEKACCKLSELCDRSDKLAQDSPENSGAQNCSDHPAEAKTRDAPQHVSKNRRQQLEVFEKFVAFRSRLTHPRYRLLRRLFERLDLASAHSSLVDLQLTSQMADLAKRNHSIEKKFKFLEVLIIAVYGVEFVDLLARDTLQHDLQLHGPWFGFFGALVMVGAAVLLYLFGRRYVEKEEPEEENDSHIGEQQTGRLRWNLIQVIAILLLLALLYVVNGARRHRAEWVHSNNDQQEMRDHLNSIDTTLKNQSRAMDELMKRSQGAGASKTKPGKSKGSPPGAK